MKDFFEGRVESKNFVADANSLRTIFNIRLLPPLLPKGAKKLEVKSDNKFDTFQLNSRKFICVEDFIDLPTAIQEAEKLDYEAVSKT